RAVAANRQLREVLKTRMPTAAAIGLARRLRPDLFVETQPLGQPQLLSEASKPPSPLPPEWLSDLFGPARTRFCSARARAVLGWAPLVKRVDGQDIAMRWLSGRDWHEDTRHIDDLILGVR